MFLNLLSQIYFMGTFLLSVLVAFAVQYFQALSGKYLSQENQRKRSDLFISVKTSKIKAGILYLVEVPLNAASLTHKLFFDH